MERSGLTDPVGPKHMDPTDPDPQHCPEQYHNVSYNVGDHYLLSVCRTFVTRYGTYRVFQYKFNYILSVYFVNCLCNAQ